MALDDAGMLHALPERAARRFGERVFLERWLASGYVLPPISFAEFARWVECARRELQKVGVSRGCRVALLAHACPDSLAVSLATPAVGAVLVNLNWRQPESTL